MTLTALLWTASYVGASEYSATMETTSPEGTFSAKVFVKGPWHRHEQDESIVLYNQKTGTTYSIIPSEKTYIEMTDENPYANPIKSMGEQNIAVGQSLSDADGTLERLPSETFAGYRCDVYRHTPNDLEFGPSTVWYSPKLHASLKVIYDGPTGVITMEYSHIAEGPQDDKLFVLPKGYKKMDLQF